MRRLAQAAALAALMVPFVACSQDEAAGACVEGRDYSTVANPRDTQDVDGVLVEEVFGYWCPHCNDFDPFLANWQAGLADDVVFERLPVMFGQPSNKLYAQAYYAAKELRILDQVHPAIFAALHTQRRRITSVDEMAQLFSTASGIMPDIAANTLKSFAVDRQVREAERQAQQYGVRGVPTLIVDGRYLLSASQLKSYERMLSCTDQLVAELSGDDAE